MFIAIDGADGSGKGVQINLLKEWLKSKNCEFIFVRDPGDTPLGEKIRALLLNEQDLKMSPGAEAALFFASRAQLVTEKIKPALNSKKTILADRYLLSTIVYQGYASGATDAEIAELWQVGSFFADNILPDFTFILDCPLEICDSRLNRNRDRIESKNTNYRAMVIEGYRKAFLNWSQDIGGEAFLIDATLPPLAVFDEIKRRLETRF